MIIKVLYLPKNFLYFPKTKFLATLLTVPSHRGIDEGPLTPCVCRFDRPIVLDPLAVFEQFEHWWKLNPSENPQP